MNISEVKKAFRKKLRTLRRERGISQEKLGEKADLHPTYIGMIERGEKSPTLDTIVKLAQALDVSLIELFNLEMPTEEDFLKGKILALIERKTKSQKQLALKVLKGLFQK